MKRYEEGKDFEWRKMESSNALARHFFTKSEKAARQAASRKEPITTKPSPKPRPAPQPPIDMGDSMGPSRRPVVGTEAKKKRTDTKILRSEETPARTRRQAYRDKKTQRRKDAHKPHPVLVSNVLHSVRPNAGTERTMREIQKETKRVRPSALSRRESEEITRQSSADAAAFKSRARTKHLTGPALNYNKGGYVKK